MTQSPDNRGKPQIHSGLILGVVFALIFATNYLLFIILSQSAFGLVEKNVLIALANGTLIGCIVTAWTRLRPISQGALVGLVIVTICASIGANGLLGQQQQVSELVSVRSAGDPAVINPVLGKSRYAPVIPISANDVIRKLTSANGKPTLLHVYASWCEHCQKMMPGMLSLLGRKELEHVNLLLVSTDVNADALGIYLSSKSYQSLFPAYITGVDQDSGIIRALQATSANFSGRVPYTALYNAEGRLVNEVTGGINKGKIIAFSGGQHVLSDFADEHGLRDSFIR